ncbi:unnamed protein product, partial [Closterium sp. Naga37s-1]
MHTPPKYGDYEAQRHWMEITLHLPPALWYHNSTSNDLAWWGLDYPPLTAWQSRMHGWVMHVLCPDAVALGSSRGYESDYSKALLRWTVLSTDLLVFFPAALAFACSPFLRRLSSAASRPASHRLWLLAMLLLQPGLILIDHGHFQYNSISLGLSLGAATAVMSRHYLLGSALFSLAINHKHMALYFAPAFFAHLLGRCRQSPRPALMFLSLAATVLLSFALCWWPFLHSTDATLQVLTRLFPLGRGLYEDHVANFWCATSPLIKWKRLFSTPLLARMALAATVTAALPSMLHQVLWPSAHGLVLAMLNSSLAFFFFAFQVHEKSILLPLLPTCMLALHHPRLHRWLSTVTLFSMFPLLLRDRLELAYTALLALFLLLSPPPSSSASSSLSSTSTSSASSAAAPPTSTPSAHQQHHDLRQRLLTFLHAAWASTQRYVVPPLLVAAAALHYAEVALPAPARFQYLYQALIVTLAFVCLVPVIVVSNLWQWGVPEDGFRLEEGERDGGRRSKGSRGGKGSKKKHE